MDVKCRELRFAVLRRFTIRSLRYHDGEGHENVAEKVNLPSFNLYRDFPNSITLQRSNATELFWSRIPDNHILIQRKKGNFVVICLRPP